MNVTLSQTFSWSGEAGAHYDIRVNGDGPQISTEFLTYDAGSNNSVLIGDLLASLDFAITGLSFTLLVRSKRPDGTLASAYSSQQKHIKIDLGGFDVPTALTIT